MFRTFLLRVRQFGAQANDKQKLVAIVSAFILWIIGAVIDKFLSFSLFFNTIRAAIAIVTAVIMFAWLYLLAIKHNEKKELDNDDFVPLRQRLTYHGRINVSIVFWALLIITVLMSSRPSLLYTFINSWVIVAALGILTFVRPSRDEFLKRRYGIPDKRDVDMDKLVRREINERKAKMAERKAQKEKEKQEKWVPERKLNKDDTQETDNQNTEKGE